MAQHALTSSDTGPWAAGFRYSTHITNGNQTSGAGAADSVFMKYKFEAQDLAQSGWDYNSTSSYVTLSFWVQASVAQNYYGYIVTDDGTQQNFPFETGSLTADTWKNNVLSNVRSVFTRRQCSRRFLCSIAQIRSFLQRTEAF